MPLCVPSYLHACVRHGHAHFHARPRPPSQPSPFQNGWATEEEIEKIFEFEDVSGPLYQAALDRITDRKKRERYPEVFGEDARNKAYSACAIGESIK